VLRNFIDKRAGLTPAKRWSRYSITQSIEYTSILKGDNMSKNTIITEHQRLKGVINGTDTRFIKSDIYPAWLNIVQQHNRGEPLTQNQVNFLELVNALSSARRHYRFQRNNFNHAEHRVPRVIKG
jgi:glycogen synthase